MNATPTPPAGWYTDPEGDPRQRYWDGQQWTDNYASPEPAEPTWLQRNRGGLIAAGVGVLGLLVLANMTGGGDTEQATPQPTATVTPRLVEEKPDPTPEPVEDVLSERELNALALDLTWDNMSRSERDLMCTGFAYDPQLMWTSFDDGADGSITRRAFMRFMTDKCA